MDLNMLVEGDPNAWPGLEPSLTRHFSRWQKDV